MHKYICRRTSKTFLFLTAIVIMFFITGCTAYKTNEQAKEHADNQAKEDEIVVYELPENMTDLGEIMQVPGTNNAERVKLSVGSNGDFHIVYFIPDAISSAGLPTNGRLYYSRYSDGNWSEPLLCADMGRESTPFQYADVAGDENGDAYVVWVNLYRARVHIVSIKDAKTAELILTRNTHNAVRADVLANSGFVFAMYREKLPEEKNIFLKKSIDDTEWIELSMSPVQGNEGQRQPSIAAGNDGIIHYGYRWMGGDAFSRFLGYRTYNIATDEWSDIIDKFKGSGKPWGPQIFVDKNNLPHMVFYDGSTQYRDPVTGSVTRLGKGGGEEAWPPTVAVTKNNNIIALSSTAHNFLHNDIQGNVYLHVKTDGVFSEPIPVETDTENQYWGSVTAYKDIVMITYVADNMIKYSTFKF